MAIEQCLKTDEKNLDFGRLGDGGGSYTREITIKNDCDHEIDVSSSFEPKINGAPMATLEHDASSWMTFVGGETKFTMGAKTSKVLQIRGYVPASADNTSYYSELNIKNDSSDQHDAEYRDVLAIPVRMDVVKGDAAVAGRLDYNRAQIIDFDGTINAKAKVSSESNYGFLAEYKLEKSPAFGLEDYAVVSEYSCEVMANGECSLGAEGAESNSGHYGIYKIRQTVTYVNGEGQRTESVLVQTVMNLPAVSLFIAGGVLFALILLFLVSKAIKYSRRDKAEAKKARRGSAEDEDAAEEERLKEANDSDEADDSDDSEDSGESGDSGNSGDEKLSKRELARVEREKAKEKKLLEKEERLRAKERAKAEKRSAKADKRSESERHSAKADKKK